jgi:ABC-type phosphate/phosphonate transport system substrate-binding protein
MKLAAINMYVLPSIVSAIDDLWSGIARAMRAEGVPDVPPALTWRSADERLWLSPDLFLAPTCGYPLVTSLLGKVKVLATPRFRIDGRAGPYYCSRILVRADCPADSLLQLKGACCAYNNPDSQSGYAAFRHAVAGVAKKGSPFFGKVLESGAHAQSLNMLREGTIDVCCVDAITLELVRMHEPWRAEGLKVIDSTAFAPGHPYITAGGVADDVLQRMRGALHVAMHDPSTQCARDALLIDGLEELPLSAYDRMLEMEREAIEAGYPKLA